MTYNATAAGCDARWRANKTYHKAGDRCGQEARYVLTVAGSTMLLCPYHRKRIEIEMARRKPINYQMRELPRPGLTGVADLEGPR